MTTYDEPYDEHVRRIESGLAAYAKKSFEPYSHIFVDGGEQFQHYQRHWTHPTGQLKLRNRTPLQLERDRILYSAGLRRQTEKYHVLYNGQRKIIRNYTTHTMRMAHVTRSICRALQLNSDFAEAIALGAKIGAVPFVHAAKHAVAEWVYTKILELDKEFAAHEPARDSKKTPQLRLALPTDVEEGVSLPSWIGELRSPSVFQRVQRYLPWAGGTDTNLLYTAGQESYWLLCTNPFVRHTRTNSFSPETMYGVWRHSRGVSLAQNSFFHKCPVSGAAAGHHEIRWDHCTYEGIVVQFADDITWVIENLNDANDAALLNSKNSHYNELLANLGEHVPEALLRALTGNDAGGLYTYFISDFVKHSSEILARLGDGVHERIALRKGLPEAVIGLSPEATHQLNLMEGFLRAKVFNEPRVKNRTQMLKTVSVACLDLLLRGREDSMPRIIRERGLLERFQSDEVTTALELLRDPVHCVQLAVDIFANMADQEIYDFVGIQAL